MSMKVTILLGSFSVGGAENMVYELVRHIDPERATISVLCYGERENNSLTKKVEAVTDVRYLGLKGGISLTSIRKVIKALDELKPDAVHAHMGSAGFAAIWSFLRNRGFVATVHTRPDKAFSSKIESLVRLRMRGKRACLVAVSKENEALVSRYFHLSQPKCCSINNGVDLARFYWKEHENYTYINVARQDENKNQRMLIRSFANLYKLCGTVRLILVGDGPLHETLKADVQALGIADAVMFTGNVGDVETYYAQSDAFVLCSYREAMPLSVLEAMAAGLPVISSRVGGLIDVVQENGILLRENSEECLTQAMLELYNSCVTLRSQWKEASKRIVQMYSAQEMAKRYMDVYSQLMG